MGLLSNRITYRRYLFYPLLLTLCILDIVSNYKIKMYFKKNIYNTTEEKKIRKKLITRA